MQKPDLVASDVDGTLLDPLAQLTERTTTAIDRLRASGTPFVLATGRPPRWLSPITEPLDLRGPAVCCNGAIVYDTGTDEILVAEELDAVLLRDVGQALGEVLPDSWFAVERAGGNRNAEPVFLSEEHYSNPWGEEAASVVPRGVLLGAPAVKLLLRDPGMPSHEMAAAASGIVGDAVAVTYSISVGLIEISVPGVSKATALAHVAEQAGVARSGVLAFGDMHNDLEMLRWAGHGVAMGNGHPDVHAAADEVTSSNADDGVAEVLERWF